MSEHELCEAAKHPVVLRDSRVKVSLGHTLAVTLLYVQALLTTPADMVESRRHSCSLYHC